MDTVFGFINDTIGVAVYDLVKQIFFLLDNVVYSLIPLLYKMILYLSNVNLFKNNETLIALSNRIYILIGVFMLFKLSFSMIRYIADPNSFSDSSKGFTGLIKNVLISLVLLVSIPYIFSFAYKIQGDIISSNVIPNFIMGTNGELNMDDFESASKDVQFIMFSPFFTLNYNVNDDLKVNCNPSVNVNDSGIVKYPLVNVLGTRDMALGPDDEGTCLKKFTELMDNNENMKASGVKLTDFFKTEEGDFRDFGSLGPLVVWREENQSVINYTPVISTIFGGYLVFLLFTFCFDVGGRAVKLLFLQILSPVAVISSIDPTESSNNSKLKEWASECLKTYLSVFLRMAIIFVIVQIVRVITEFIFADGLSNQSFGQLGSPSSFESLFIYIFLVIGGFQAAKSFPALIEKAFGVKMSGELNLNPFKNPLVAGLTGGIVGGAVGAGATSLASGATAFATGQGPLGVLKSATAGLGVGAFRGARGGYGKKLGEAFKAGTHSGGISSRNMMMRDDLGISWTKGNFKNSAKKQAEMTATRILDTAGGPTPYQMWHSKVIRYDSVSEQANKLSEIVNNNSTKSRAVSRDGVNTYEDRFKYYDDSVMAAKVAYENQQISLSDYRASIDDIDEKRKSLRNEYYQSAKTGNLQQRDQNGNLVSIHDYEVENGNKSLESKYKESGLQGSVKSIDDLGDVKKLGFDARNASEQITSNQTYRDLERVHTTRENVSRENFYESGSRK